MDSLFPEISEEDTGLSQLFMAPTDPKEERKRVAAQFVDPNAQGGLATEVASRLSDESINRRAEEFINNISDSSEVPTVASKIKEMSTRVGKAEVLDVEAGVSDTLSDEEDYDKARQDYDALAARHRNNIKIIRDSLTGMLEGPSLKQASRFSVISEKLTGTVFGDVASKIRTQREAGAAVFLPGYQTLKLANILEDVVPGFKFSDMKNAAKVLNEFRSHLVGLPEDQLQTVLEKLQESLVESAQGWTGNQWLARQLAEEILGGIGEDDRGALTTAGVYLDIFGVAVGLKTLGTVAKAQRNLVKAAKSEVPGVVETSLASTIIRTKKGADELGQAVVKGEDAKLAAVGAKAEEVVDDLLIPNTFDHAPTSKPYLPEMMLTDAERAGALERASTEVGKVLKNRLQVKLNDSSIDYVEGGYNATLRIGLSSGRGMKSEKAARNMANLNGMKADQYKIVKSADSEEYFLEMNVSKTWGKDDMLPYQEVLRDGEGFAGGLFGANTHFAADIVNTANDAAKRSANMKVAMRETLKPYAGLSAGQKVKVNSLLRDFDGISYPTEAQMRLYGLDDDQIRAAESVYNAGRKHLAELNDLTRSRMKDNGIKVYRSGPEGRQFTAAEIDRTAFFPANKVTDLKTGQAIDFESVRLNLEDYRLFRMMDETGKPRYGVVKRTEEMQVSELPPMVVHQIPGYIPRKYDTPFYIYKRTPDGESVEFSTVMTARSPKAANQAAEQLRLEDPKSVFEVRRAQELVTSPTTWDELDSLREAGLLRTGSRRKDIIPDAEGLSNLRGIEESIDAMVNSTGRAAGVSRWTDAAIARWEATFADKFGQFNMAAIPKGMESTLTVQQEWKAAKALRDHIMMINGVHENGLAKMSASWRNKVADALYNRRLGVLGDELSGFSSPLTDAGKKTAGAMFLFLNPVRQALMQSTMIPTYAGVKGGMKYMAGGYQKDWLDIVVNKRGPMYEAWKKHGTGAFVDDHLFKVGMSADSGFGLSGTFAQPLGRVVEFSKKIGFDAGTMNDKLAQFLFSTNRFKTINGRMPNTSKEWDEIAAFGENLGMNMNSSDALLTQQGVFGLMTQFMAHSIKMTGRLLGQEGQFTRAEKFRMAGMTALTYGTAGYGINEGFRAAMNALDVKLEPEVLQGIEEGLAGMVLDTVFGLWDTDDEETRLAFSSRFSPTAGGIIGITPDLVMRMFNGTASVGHVIGELPFARDPAALGAGSAVAQSVTLAGKLFTRSDLPASEITAASATKFFEAFPIYSNAMRGMAAFRHGEIKDAKGIVITDMAKGSAIARGLLGVRSKDEAELEAAMAEFYGMYTEQSQEGLKGAMRRDADATLGVLVPMFTKFADGEVTMANISKFLDQHQAAILDNIESDELRHAYQDHLWKGLEATGVTKSQKFAEQLMRSVGRDITTEDARDLLKKHNPPGADKLIDWLNGILETRK